MSVVAVKNNDSKIEIAADSILGYGQGHQTKAKDNEIGKLFKTNGMIIGAVGYGSDINMMYLFAKNHKPSGDSEYDVLEFFSEFDDWCRKKKNNYENESSFILIYQKKIFEVTRYYDVELIKNYTSIGAGKSYADTALYLGLGVKKAVEVACELCLYCEQPIRYFSIKK